MVPNKELIDDFWQRVRSWNGYRQNCFTGVRQIGDWQIQFRTPDGLTGIYDGLRHITRRVFDNFDDMDEYWFNWETSFTYAYNVFLDLGCFIHRSMLILAHSWILVPRSCAVISSFLAMSFSSL